MLLQAEAFALAFDAYQRAVALDPRDSAALAGFAQAAAGARREADARAELEAIARREPENAPVRVELSHVLAAGGDLQGALTAANEAVRIAPNDPRAGEQLASVLADASAADRLLPLADALRERFPDRIDPQYYRATALYLRGKTDEAIAALRRVVETHPTHARAQNLLGAACASEGRADCARAAFEAAIRANPRDPSPYVNLGVFRVRAGDPRGALDPFGQALALDPQSAAAREGLAQARAALLTNPR